MYSSLDLLIKNLANKADKLNEIDCDCPDSRYCPDVQTARSLRDVIAAEGTYKTWGDYHIARGLREIVNYKFEKLLCAGITFRNG